MLWPRKTSSPRKDTSLRPARCRDPGDWRVKTKIFQEHARRRSILRESIVILRILGLQSSACHRPPKQHAGKPVLWRWHRARTMCALDHGYSILSRLMIVRFIPETRQMFRECGCNQNPRSALPAYLGLVYELGGEVAFRFPSCLQHLLY